MTGLNHSQLAEHIRRLIDYNWTDELEDYEADENDSREVHIFRTLVALNNYIEGTELTPESYLRSARPARKPPLRADHSTTEPEANRWEVKVSVFLTVEAETTAAARRKAEDCIDIAHIGDQLPGVLSVGVDDWDVLPADEEE